MASEFAPRGARLPVGVVASVAGPLVLRDRQGLDDMATTIEAEDTFDLATCASPIAAPTLIVAGRDDRFYATELFEETARLIPGSDLRLLDGKGHIGALGDARCRDALESWRLASELPESSREEHQRVAVAVLHVLDAPDPQPVVARLVDRLDATADVRQRALHERQLLPPREAGATSSTGRPAKWLASASCSAPSTLIP